MSDRAWWALALAVLLALGAAGYGVHMECVGGTCGPVVHGRRLVLAAMAEWWRETPPQAPEEVEAAAAALRSAQRAEIAGLVARQTVRAAEATGEALARARGRVASA